MKEAQEWLDANAQAEKDEFEQKLKDVEGVCNPIISKAYAQSGGPGGAGQAGGEDYESHDDL